MKISSFILALVLTGFNASAQLNPVTNPRKIQIAILFDTSNSMDGLLEQAKSTIWQIVNAASKLQHTGSRPSLEISLFDYGNDNIPSTSNFVRKQVNLISDLDLISEKLFGLSTRGGSEYCGAVIQSSLNELDWSTNPQDLKIIYIAGNEPFNQGSVHYKEVMQVAVTRNIIVNTIYCGPYDQGVREFWYDGAQIGKGTYFNIDSNREVVHIDTPYDQKISTYNDSLNGTYIGYGREGENRKMKQMEQDKNASSKGAGTVSERTVAKSAPQYTNASWDMIDAVEESKIDIKSLRDDELPKELQGKTAEEKEVFVKQKAEERSNYQKEIGELAVKREAFIAEEKKKRASESGTEDLGTSIVKSMISSAVAIGFSEK